jgi:mRNA interferase RelE/StbE
VSDAYSIRLAPGVLRTLQTGPPKGIPLNAEWAIFEFIRGPLSQDPWRVFKPLHDELEAFRGARRGEDGPGVLLGLEQAGDQRVLEQPQRGRRRV